MLSVSSFTHLRAIRPAGLNVPGTGVHPNMLEKLASLEGSLVTDAAELARPDARETLEKLGFTREQTTGAHESWKLGLAHPHGAGQRAVFRPDGSCQLVTFAEQWVQLTHVDAQGRRLGNGVERIPMMR